MGLPVTIGYTSSAGASRQRAYSAVYSTTARKIGHTVVTAPAFEPITEAKAAEVATLLESADAAVVAGPIDGENERLARQADRLFAPERIPDPPANARVVPNGTLRSALNEVDAIGSSPPP